MPRRTTWLLLAVLATTTAALLANGPRADAVPPPSLNGVNFISVCKFSHRGQNDPIVLPRQPGASHDHTFVGNSSTDAFSTPASLRTATTTCSRRGDTAAYWMPTLLVRGDPVTPTAALAYYRRATRKAVRPFPPGLQMVAGNAASTRPQSLLVTYWDCGDLVNVPRSSDVPPCPEDAALSLHVNFPDCWDGKNLLAANQGHMAYSVNGRCRADHPVALPALSLVFRYPVTSVNAVELASGGQHSGHADFINAWDQQALAKLVASCLNSYRHCGTGA